MKVYIKNKFISWGGSSTVVDENNIPVFNVKGSVFSITRKKYIQNLDGTTLYVVRNKWFNWFVHSAYVYDAEGNKLAKVKEKYFSLKREYFIEGCQDEMKIDGAFFSLTSNILKNGEVVGTIRREINFFVDSFELEAKPEDMPFMIALVIALDNIKDNKAKNSR